MPKTHWVIDVAFRLVFICDIVPRVEQGIDYSPGIYAMKHDLMGIRIKNSNNLTLSIMPPSKSQPPRGKTNKKLSP